MEIQHQEYLTFSKAAIELEIKTGISRLRVSIVPKKDKAHIQNKTVRNIFTPRDLTFRACFALINM